MPKAAPKVTLTDEQQARLDAFDAMVAQRQRRWEALSPQQQREEIEGWKRAMTHMNEDRKRSGQRVLFVDGIE
jgi:hypothetical protein